MNLGALVEERGAFECDEIDFLGSHAGAFGFSEDLDARGHGAA
jgi:hypothetical protein